jgi:two-component system response regulator RegA
MTDPSRSILLVDDDEVFRERLARAFRGRGFLVTEAADVPQAGTALRAGLPDLAVIDLRLPSGSGLDVVRLVKRRSPRTVMVVLTGYGSIATALDAVALGATHYLTKPATIDDILAGFARATPAPEEPVPAAAPLEREVLSLARVEWEHINRVLADCDGNVSEAARRLGMHRRSLQRKLSKHPMPR